MFVEGRAKAILEEFEETRGGIPLDFATLSAKLKEHFEDVSGRENGMMIFESRVKQLNESVEEFMQALVSLYSDANPTHAAEIKLEAVKRKFLQGISPELRKTISVFCNNPFVTREQLLQHCRQAKTHLMGTSSHSSHSHDNSAKVLAAEVSDANHGGGLVAAINNLSLQFRNHVENTDARFNYLDNMCAVNYRGDNGGYNNGGRSRGVYMGRGGSYRGNRGNAFASTRSPNRGRYFRQGRYNGSKSRGGGFKCFKCNGPNHFARDCTQSENE